MDDISSQRPFFSDDPTTLGFDLSAGNVWIYPENYPIREYQFTIVKNALYRNTLVCLPTGLGKTFIAAVLMYNFWRWYPKGKVVFLAPTKPLVAQQIHACHEIMGIPSEETIELTGTINQKLREVAWSNKRVIFATPQTFHKDLEKNILPLNLVKCLVIDEAHKALGKHSYCESVRLLSAQNNYFRVLALSATPGDKISKVHEVITNLHISSLELRDDSSPDITPYINERKLDVVLVRLSDELARFKERYISVMDPHVRFLVRFNILRGDTGNISKGRIFHLLKEFQSKPNKTGNYGQIMRTLNILQTMSHAYELMIRHGLRSFLHFYENHSEKSWLAQEVSLHQMLDDIKNYLGPFPIIEPLPDGSIPDVPKDLLFGHNKFYKLKEILERHFKSYRDKNEDTRAIVFVEYRDIVNEVHVLLLQCRPLIRPQMFVGQAGQKRKQQIEALENFRTNKVNVLISTSVGEEGLDVGEVDLIVCFDSSQNSPIRLVQRMGRTGRKRDGYIVALVTDGKEHESLKATMSKKDSLNSKVLQSSSIISALYEESPRMIPNQCKPECRKMHMKVLAKTPKVKGAAKKKDVQRKEVQRNKKKNTDLMLTENDNGVKSAGQSSIQNFFKTTKPGEKIANSSHFPFSQAQQNISIRDVNLYFSDKESEEFLTLCAMRKTRVSLDVLDFEINERYITSYPRKDPADLNHLRNLVIPDLNAIDYTELIPNIIETDMPEMVNQEMTYSQIQQDNFLSPCFNDESRLSDTFFKTGEMTIEKSFADLIYDSSSSAMSEIVDDDFPNEFEVTRNFDTMMETTDESEIEVEMEMQMELGVIKNEIKIESNEIEIDARIDESSNHRKKISNTEEIKSKRMLNFSNLLADSSFDSTINQETSHGNISSEKTGNNRISVNEKTFNEKELLRKENDNSRNCREISSNAQIPERKEMFRFSDILEESSSDEEIPSNTKISERKEMSRFSNILKETNSDSIKCQDLEKSNKKNSSTNINVFNATNSMKGQNPSQDKMEKMLNASNLLGGTSLDLINTQDFFNFGPLSNKDHTRQENISRDNSIMTLSSNCSGITVTQAVEEIGRINGNKSINNNSLFKEKSTPLSALINKSPVIKNLEKNIPSVSNVKEIVYDIADSDDELFISEIKDLSITSNDNKVVNSSEIAVENKLLNVPKGKTVTMGSMQIMQMDSSKSANDLKGNSKKLFSLNKKENLNKETINEKGHSSKEISASISAKNGNSSKEIPIYKKGNSSKEIVNEKGNLNKLALINEKEISKSNNKNENKLISERGNSNKSLSINEKENSRLSFNIINDDDWDSDFDIFTSELNSTSLYFKNDIQKEKSTPITKIPEEISNNQNIPEKRFSLFKRDKPFSLIQNSNDNNQKSNVNSKNNDVSIVEVFKKPDLNISGLLSVRRSNSNAPSTSNERMNKNLDSRVKEKRKFNREISFNKTLVESPEIKRKKLKKRRRNCDFIDNEADVSTDECDTSDGTSGEDDDLEDFVSYTQNETDVVDMRAHYMKSVRSPLRRPGAFLIKKSSHVHEDVYSQPASQLNDTYVQDSFCVTGDEIEYVDDESEDDLQITYEKISETPEKRNKRKREKSPIFKSNKRKRRKGRIQNFNNSSSSEDEIEQMRNQIQNKSILLRK